MSPNFDPTLVPIEFDSLLIYIFSIKEVPGTVVSSS